MTEAVIGKNQKHHSVLIDIIGRGIEKCPISDETYKNLMRVPWNVPLGYQGMLFDPITSDCIRGYKILAVE
jgi:hypothetical protein